MLSTICLQARRITKICFPDRFVLNWLRNKYSTFQRPDIWAENGASPAAALPFTALCHAARYQLNYFTLSGLNFNVLLTICTTWVQCSLNTKSLGRCQAKFTFLGNYVAVPHPFRPTQLSVWCHLKKVFLVFGWYIFHIKMIPGLFWTSLCHCFCYAIFLCHFRGLWVTCVMLVLVQKSREQKNPWKNSVFSYTWPSKDRCAQLVCPISSNKVSSGWSGSSA
jgi:hypothetical protein